MEPEEIRVYNHPNTHIKSFLTNTVIWPYTVGHFKNPWREIPQDEIKNLGLVSTQLVREIMEIQGVAEIFIKPKEIRVKKEASSSWIEIESRVKSIVKRIIRKKQIKAVK